MSVGVAGHPPSVSGGGRGAAQIKRQRPDLTREDSGIINTRRAPSTGGLTDALPTAPVSASLAAPPPHTCHHQPTDRPTDHPVSARPSSLPVNRQTLKPPPPHGRSLPASERHRRLPPLHSVTNDLVIRRQPLHATRGSF